MALIEILCGAVEAARRVADRYMAD